MLSSGNDESKELSPKIEPALFFLDECLPYKVADSLRLVGYPITSWKDEFQWQQGYKDSPLIQYLGAKRYCWITKDDEAKQEHQSEIITAQISVVWVCGLAHLKKQPRRNYISSQDLHRMLTLRLNDIKEKITTSQKPQYFVLYMRKSGKVILQKIPLSDFFKTL
jgi:predicted nuclease of predicted toxin-antitoxin system